MKPVKALVSLSGGMDSATVLGKVVSQGSRVVQAVGFSYGSKHGQYEQAAAARLAEYYQVPYKVIDITSVMQHFKSNLLLGGGDIPEGHYEEKTMEQTVVPARNMIFCSILAGIAVSEGCQEIWLGVHAGDHAIYPDCRPEFIASMEETIHHATDQSIFLKTPYLTMKKIDILRDGYSFGRKVPYNLTRTCYKAQPIACGKCGSCQERLESFKLLGMEDPIEYAWRGILPREKAKV